MSAPLSHADKIKAFRRATANLARRIEKQGATPMDDPALEAALRDELGIFGGCGGPAQMHLTWQGSGLKIWASWHVHNHVRERPVLAGAATIAMARMIYGIPDPRDIQLRLF